MFGGAPDSLVVSPPAAPAGEVGPTGEAELRAQLATAADPTGPALELARLLDVEERLAEALLAVDVARRRRPGEPLLQIARAGILRDLGRRAEALRELTAVLDRTGDGAVEAGLLFEWAELAALENDLPLARRAVARLQTECAGDEFTSRHGDEVAQLTAVLASDQHLVPTRVRDLLGDLRGNASADRRLESFTRLSSIGGEVAARAVTAILDDPDPRLRSQGVRAAPVAAAVLAEFCALALSDPAAAVRAAGAERTTALPSAEAAVLLLPTLAAETDPEAFAALHAALRQVTGTGVDVTAEAMADAAARAAVVTEWRTQWER